MALKKKKTSEPNPRLMGAVEAIVFASGDPVSVEQIAEVLEVDRRTLEPQIGFLMEETNREGRGIRLVELDGYLQMCTVSEYSEAVRKTLEMRRNTPLSQAAMEVLAVIAYNQPVTKAYIEQVRGVDCGAVLNGLTAKGLIEERGRLELPGRPLLYGTTPDFLRCLNIQSLQELPPPPRAASRAEAPEPSPAE